MLKQLFENLLSIFRTVLCQHSTNPTPLQGRPHVSLPGGNHVASSAREKEAVMKSITRSIRTGCGMFPYVAGTNGEFLVHLSASDTYPAAVMSHRYPHTQSRTSSQSFP